jgi:S1-C subfamily serine protease
MSEPLGSSMEPPQRAQRARSLIGRTGDRGSPVRTESADADAPPPLGQDDVEAIARRIVIDGAIDFERATAYASNIVAAAGDALVKLDGGLSSSALSDFEASALESVIHVRGRPALRVLGIRLESLARYPGSEFWQEYVGASEDRIAAVASATGALVVTSATGGLPPYTQGSAWLVSPHRVVTNRHVLRPSNDAALIESDGASGLKLRAGKGLFVEFAADDRAPSARLRRAVTSILYVAEAGDRVDIAVLEIEPFNDVTPLRLAPPGDATPDFLYVVGHPGLSSSIPAEVRAVFGTPDGRKRVSFGKRMTTPANGVLTHDASTIGGYSGGPVAHSSGQVIGLHYYGDPASGNRAVTARAIREHESFKHLPAA